MPKEAGVHVPSKRRGRKRKHGRGIGRKRKDVAENSSLTKIEVPIDDLESIIAQTATNLKAFRQLFGSHEETEEEFLGYYPMEIVAVKTTFRRKGKIINHEISYLESLLQSAPRVTTSIPQEIPNVMSK